MSLAKIMEYINKNKGANLYDIRMKFNLTNSDMKILTPFLISQGIKFEIIDKIATACDSCPVGVKCSKNKNNGGEGCGI